MDGEVLSEFIEEAEFCSFSDDIFSVLEAWDNGSDYYNNNPATKSPEEINGGFEFQKLSRSNSSPMISGSETEMEAASPKRKWQKVAEDGRQRISHITVERNRRKQMNDHISVLRSLMPSFYVKRGDQASIIGGVVNYINELQQVLQSLEAKKQRKAAYTDVVLSPRVASSPRGLPLSPRKPPLSPRVSLPISPRTPLPQASSSPYKPWMHHRHPSLPPSPSNSTASSSINDAVNELVATSKSAVAEVEVKFSGPNLLLKTVSHRVPGQVLKIVSALEQLALEILHVSISRVDERMLNSFTIKVGIECQLSAEELADQIQQTFC